MSEGSTPEGLERPPSQESKGAGEGDEATPSRPLARYTGPSHSAPYPISRMAPAYALVDTAREIAEADSMLHLMTDGKLGLIAEQIRSLRAKAEEILDRARLDAELHRVRTNLEKKVGGVYHLYQRHDSGEKWFLLVGPEEWSSPPKMDFLGTFRLEADMSFTKLG